jgi:hypothetical protein
MEVFDFWTNLTNHPGWLKALTISGMIFWGCLIVCLLVAIFARAHAVEPPDTKIYEDKFKSNEENSRLV